MRIKAAAINFLTGTGTCLLHLESSKMKGASLKHVIIAIVIVIAFAVLLGTAPYVSGY